MLWNNPNEKKREENEKIPLKDVHKFPDHPIDFKIRIIGNNLVHLENRIEDLHSLLGIVDQRLDNLSNRLDQVEKVVKRLENQNYEGSRL